MKQPKIVTSKSIYSDSYLKIIHDRLTYSSNEWNQIFFDKVYKNSVVVIPVESNGVYLIRQYRHPIRKFLWQFPAGTFEKNVSSLKLAHKELREETGMVAREMKKIGTLYSEPGLSTDKTDVYVAQQVKKLYKRNLDLSEIGMNMSFFKFGEIDIMIKEGKITCGITLSAYLLFLFYTKRLTS